MTRHDYRALRRELYDERIKMITCGMDFLTIAMEMENEKLSAFCYFVDQALTYPNTEIVTLINRGKKSHKELRIALSNLNAGESFALIHAMQKAQCDADAGLDVPWRSLEWFEKKKWEREIHNYSYDFELSNKLHRWLADAASAAEMTESEFIKKLILEEHKHGKYFINGDHWRH